MSSLRPYDVCQVFSRNWSNDKYGSQPHFSYLSRKIPTRLYIVMCSSFKLQIITPFQGLSCLWRHNNARMITFLALFHNSFHRICATLGATCSNKLFWSNMLNRLSLSKSMFFSPLFFEVLHALDVVIWIHNSCCSLGTTIQVEKHQ